MSLFRSLSSASAPKVITDSNEKVQKIIDDNNVVVFSKTWCSYSSQTKSTLSSLDADFLIVELDRESDGGDLQEALEAISGQRTVPNVYINQKHIGGNSDVQALVSSKKLKGLLTEAGALKA